MAWSTADTESEPKQPSRKQTRYMIRCAPGAMPLTAPRLTPRSVALATGLPTAVDEVCVPWPSASRAEQTSVALLQFSPGTAALRAMYVAVFA